MKKNRHVFLDNYFPYLLITLLSFSISYIFLHHQLSVMPTFEFKGDAGDYIFKSTSITEMMRNGIRTYGYPLFLKLINYPYFTSQTKAHIFSFYILIVQYILYASSVFFFAYSVTTSKNMRFLIVAALLLQINVLSMLSVTLSDVLSLSLLLSICGIFFGMQKSQWRVFLLGLSAAFAIEVRPANLWVYAMVVILLTLECIKNRSSAKEGLKTIAYFFLGSLISFLPQLYLNYIYFHKITPLPAGGLGQSQFQWGQKWVFISFSLGQKGFANIVENPFLLSSPYPFNWLSINGLSYGLLKIMVMFNHSFLFVYQNMRESYEQIMVLFSSFSTYFGIWGILLQHKNIPLEKSRALFIGLFLCILLHLFTTLEDRFTFAICLLLMPFAMYQFWQFLKEKKFIPLLFFILFFLFVNLFNNILEALSPSYITAVKAQVLK